MAGEWKVYNGFYYDERLFEEFSALTEFLNGAGGLMLISGPSGCGKTALADAMVREARERRERAGVFTTAEAARAVVERIKDDRPTPDSLPDEYGSYDLIVLEEYGDLAGKPATQWEMRKGFLEPLVHAGKKVILTLVERRDRSEVIALPAHTRVQLAPAAVCVRRAFVRDYTRELGMEADADVETYLAQNYPIHIIKGIIHRGWLNGALTGRMFDMDKPEVLDRLYQPGRVRAPAGHEGDAGAQ